MSEPACQRVRQAEGDGTLAALLDELAGDAAHLERCPICRAALARYRKLADGLALLGAGARRRPDHVARVLAAASAQSAPAQHVTPLRPRRARRRAIVWLAPLAALAALAALIWWLRRAPSPDEPGPLDVVQADARVADDARPTRPQPTLRPPVRFAFRVVKQNGAALRGDAQLGDRLRVTLPAGSALWLYRNDRELLLVCPGDCRRQGDAFTAERALDTLGHYQLVWLSTDRVPPPTGELQADIAAARAAGATHELRELDVE